MNIRAYSIGDREACISIFRSNVPVFFAPSEEDSFLEFLGNPGATLVCGEDIGEVVAFGGYYVKGTVGRLCWGMVHSSRHRQGIGTAMLRSRLRSLFEIPEVRVILITTSQHSLGFFSRLGFEQKAVVENGLALGLHAVEMQLMRGDSLSLIHVNH